MWRTRRTPRARSFRGEGLPGTAWAADLGRARVVEALDRDLSWATSRGIRPAATVAYGNARPSAGGAFAAALRGSRAPPPSLYVPRRSAPGFTALQSAEQVQGYWVSPACGHVARTLRAVPPNDIIGAHVLPCSPGGPRRQGSCTRPSAPHTRQRRPLPLRRHGARQLRQGLTLPPRVRALNKDGVTADELALAKDHLKGSLSSQARVVVLQERLRVRCLRRLPLGGEFPGQIDRVRPD